MDEMPSPAPARSGDTIQRDRRLFSFTALRRLFPIAVLVVLCAVFSALSPRFLTLGNLSIVLEQGTVLLVAALGMTFVIIAGSIDLSVGSIVALSALASALTADQLGAAAIIPAAAVGVVAGLVNGVIIAKGKVPSFIATMGAMVVYRGIVLLFTRGAPISIDGDDFLSTYADRSWGIPHSVAIGLALAAVAFVILNRTVFGREVRAVGGGERVAVLTAFASPVSRSRCMRCWADSAASRACCKGRGAMAATAQPRRRAGTGCHCRGGGRWNAADRGRRQYFRHHAWGADHHAPVQRHEI